MRITRGVFYRFWDAEHGPFGLLAVTVLLVFVISPLAVMGTLDPLIVDICFVIFLFAGVLTVHPRPVTRYLVLILAVLAVLTRVTSTIVTGATIAIVDAMVDVTAIGLFSALVMKQFLTTGRPATHRITGAIVVYVLLGLLWSRLYEVAEHMIPGAFNMVNDRATLGSYVYFSFVTLATLGYGDISPVHPLVRNLAVLEAITGQMYIAVLIARLVSISDPGDQRG